MAGLHGCLRCYSSASFMLARLSSLLFVVCSDRIQPPVHDSARRAAITADAVAPCSLYLRGGSQVLLPPAGPPAQAGETRKCAQCGATQFEITLDYCRITELHFCHAKPCRKNHWKNNKSFWREQVQATKKTVNLNGVPLPVESTYTRLGRKRGDDIFPDDSDRSSPQPEREFGQPFPTVDRFRHTWDEDYEGINRILWDAAADDNVELMKSAIEDGACMNAGNPTDFYRWNSLHRYGCCVH